MIAALAATTLLLASPLFPLEVRGHLSLSYTPGCTLCHDTSAGGLGTANTPFGVSMRLRGLVANNVGSLNLALDALQAEGTDSDSDGIGDILELQAATDPNSNSGLGPTPEYGCFGRIGPAHPGLGATFLALVSLLGCLRARSSRQRS